MTETPADAGRNIVICCDGTGNQVTGNLSNVLKLFRIAVKDEGQHVWYHPGVGTIGMDSAWERLRVQFKAVFGLTTGYGLDDDILRAYCFLARTYRPGDRVYLFGFSRGAYTVRALAAFIHMIGLLRPDQVDLAAYALTTYKRAGWQSEDAYDAAKRRGTDLPAPAAPAGASAGGARSYPAGFVAAWDFGKVTGTRRVPIHFLGVWDTVSSVIVPGASPLSLPRMRTLPYTRFNPSVRAFRHAIAIDERRRMFRLNSWKDGQTYVVDPFAHPPVTQPQDCAQLRFAGVHSDIGGGYPEAESGLAKIPLIWMIKEAVKNGLRIDDAAFRRIALGEDPKYAKPDPLGPLHNSLTLGWWPLEVLPKSAKWREWRRWSVLGWYLPLGEPRVVVQADPLHPAVVERQQRATDPRYDPVNLREPRHGWTPPEGWFGPFARKVLGAIVVAAILVALLWAGRCWWEHRHHRHRHHHEHPNCMPVETMTASAGPAAARWVCSEAPPGLLPPRG
ncbi:MAG TPA: DUF2235 domain-containing protein [Allosphingosinicella sp.]|nr:DUF2235 domain-containing protein [Allosphingosinicella sp.]